MTPQVLAILLALTAPTGSTIDEADAVQQPAQVAYYQDQQEQQIIHGAGGCTPNFSTGGCL